MTQSGNQNSGSIHHQPADLARARDTAPPATPGKQNEEHTDPDPLPLAETSGRGKRSPPSHFLTRNEDSI
jgi:hypothetical protein